MGTHRRADRTGFPRDFLLYLKGVSPKGWLTQDAHIREESRLQMLATFDELLKKLTAAKTPPRKWRLPIVDTTPVATFTLRNWESLLADEVFSDMRFQTEGQMLPAHKCVLAAASPYFAALFRGDWLEMQGPVMITSNSLPVMRAVLRFLYTGVLNEDILSEYLLELVDVSAEYQLKVRGAYLRAVCADADATTDTADKCDMPNQVHPFIPPYSHTPHTTHLHTHADIHTRTYTRTTHLARTTRLHTYAITPMPARESHEYTFTYYEHVFYVVGKTATANMILLDFSVITTTTAVAATGLEVAMRGALHLHINAGQSGRQAQTRHSAQHENTKGRTVRHGGGQGSRSTYTIRHVGAGAVPPRVVAGAPVGGGGLLRTAGEERQARGGRRRGCWAATK